VIFSGNLGDLEESSPTLGRPPCTELYAQAIQVAEREYGNRHVYPYLYSAGAYLCSLHLFYRTDLRTSVGTDPDPRSISRADTFLGPNILFFSVFLRVLSA
jgi:hypothetical protein